MKRRQFLAGVTGGSVLITGCMGQGKLTAQDSVNANDAAEHMEAAQDRLDEASKLLDAEAEKFDTVKDGVVDIRTGRIEQLLDEADTELNTAEEVATNEQQETIERLRDFISWLRAITAAMAASGDVYDEWSVGMSYWDNDRYKDAADQMLVVRDYVDEARQALAVAQDRYERVKEDLDDYDSEAMGQIDEWLFAMDIIADGYRSFALGFHHFMPAAEAYDDEQWEEAADGFAEARNKFVNAEGTFRDGEDRVARWLRSYFIELSCFTEALADGSEAFRESALAASRNDWDTANEKADEAERAMDSCS